MTAKLVNNKNLGCIHSRLINGKIKVLQKLVNTWEIWGMWHTGGHRSTIRFFLFLVLRISSVCQMLNNIPMITKSVVLVNAMTKVILKTAASLMWSESMKKNSKICLILPGHFLKNLWISRKQLQKLSTCKNLRIPQSVKTWGNGSSRSYMPQFLCLAYVNQLIIARGMETFMSMMRKASIKFEWSDSSLSSSWAKTSPGHQWVELLTKSP